MRPAVGVLILAIGSSPSFSSMASRPDGRGIRLDSKSLEE